MRDFTARESSIAIWSVIIIGLLSDTLIEVIAKWIGI